MLTINWVSGGDLSIFGQTVGSGVAPSVGSTSINVPLGQVLKGYMEAGRSNTPPSKDSDAWRSLEVLMSPGTPSVPLTSEQVGTTTSPTVVTVTMNGVTYGPSGSSLAALLAELADSMEIGRAHV